MCEFAGVASGLRVDPGDGKARWHGALHGDARAWAQR